jgi:hypothetical protein
MKKLLALVVFTTTLTLFAQAQQNLNASIGVRLNLAGGVGVTFKKYKGEHTAKEWYFSYRNQIFKDFELGWTRQYQFHIAEVSGLRAYAGGGLVARMTTFGKEIFDNLQYGSIGVAAVGGLEYTIPNVPIVIGFDWMPTYNIRGNRNANKDYFFTAKGGGISIRYAISRKS